MYRYKMPGVTLLTVSNTTEGETIEQKLERMKASGEPIEGAAQATLNYQERSAGVSPDCDIRTDRWEYAVDAADKGSAAHIAKREMGIGERTYDTMTPEQQKEFNIKFPQNKHNKNTGGESIPGTN